ncbi:MAG: transcription-repair coupling factor, partial [Nitrospinota bacterium]
MALYTAALFSETGKNILAVAPDPALAETLFGNICFFAGGPGGKKNVLYLPQFETLPYEPLSPHPDIAAARIKTLILMAEKKEPYVLVTTPAALSQKCAPENMLEKSFMHIKVGDSTDREKLAEFFALGGYVFSDPVEEPGAFAFRGGILDCYPPDEETPLRIEFFGDEVESIRRFDVETQRSMKFLRETAVPPMKETNYLNSDPGFIVGNLDKLDAMGSGGSGNSGSSPALARVRASFLNREFFPAMERFLPLFYEKTAAPADYLPEDVAAVLFEPEKINEHIDLYRDQINEGYEGTGGRGELYPRPEELFVDDEKLKSLLDALPGLTLASLSVEEDGGCCVSVKASEMERLRGAFSRFIYDCKNRLKEGVSTMVAVRDEKSARRIKNLFADEDIGVTELGPEELKDRLRSCMAEAKTKIPGMPAPAVMATVGNLSSGFYLPSARIALITEEEIFGRHVEARKKRLAVFATDFSDVKPGDYVVHRDHGVGIYHGASTVSTRGAKDEYLELEYSDNQSLFLPISSIHLLEKYSGAGGPKPPLDRMGGKTWDKTRAKIKKGIMKMAKELLATYARRQTEKAFAFSKENHFSREFSDSFEFTETPDQAAAIGDVIKDMESENTMDRLVCGDVGYGKTEVALRAAFKAALDGKQTAVLCPTTLLVNQHLKNFKSRLAPFAARVEELSRFVPKPRQKEILDELKNGKVDIVIGTHRLLQKDVKFSSLGLLIVDEEQRFGVRHKERLKKMSASLDVLTLSATPIPRTLHMSISGIRDISIINTPPPGRRSIKTFIRKFSGETVKHAVDRELSRGGQVFFVHNKVETIQSMHTYVKKLLPSVRVSVAHGQMPARELEKTMENFVKRRIDVLLCTTIIESGLDIPNANTIIINGADKFGLAQLYQLRGRVGRARHRAYAYILVPDAMTPLAGKRIKAVEELSELGSGFKLAARDMEIRGAGNL